MGEILFKEESYAIQGAAFDVYREFGAGQKEVIYQNAFAITLKERGLNVEREKRISMKFREKHVGMYVPDFVVNESVLIELKAKPNLFKEDIAQFWQYLRNTKYRLGYLINFGKPGGVQIVRRIYDTSRTQQ